MDTLYAKVKSEADEKFLAKTSAYKSAWIVREYKKRGGTFKKTKQGLTRWFQEKWTDVNRPGQPCGRSKASLSDKYPLCRPTIRVTKQTPALLQDISTDDISSANQKKQKIKNTGRINRVMKEANEPLIELIKLHSSKSAVALRGCLEEKERKKWEDILAQAIQLNSKYAELKKEKIFEYGCEQTRMMYKLSSVMVDKPMLQMMMSKCAPKYIAFIIEGDKLTLKNSKAIQKFLCK